MCLHTVVKLKKKIIISNLRRVPFYGLRLKTYGISYNFAGIALIVRIIFYQKSVENRLFSLIQIKRTK